MNDRFKFRAWDTGLNMMMESLIDFDHASEELCVHVGQILMQCTGLRDKDGALIFEGDVVGHDEGAVGGKQTEFCRYEVKIGEFSCECGDYYCTEGGVGVHVVGYRGFRRPDGSVDKYGGVTGLSHCPYVGRWSVLGNIHANPELMEAV